MMKRLYLEWSALKLIWVLLTLAILRLSLFMLHPKKIDHLRFNSHQIQTESIWSARLKRLKNPLLLGFALALVLVSLQTYSQTAIGSIQLPQTPAFPQGQDRIKAADGTECQRSTAPRRKWMEVGVVGTGLSGQGVENSYPFVGGGGVIPSAQPYSRAGGAVYGRIIINLDAEQSELDCNYLYALEIDRLKAELEQTKLIGVGKVVPK